MRRELRFGAAPRAAGVRSTALAMRSRATCVKSSAMSGERRRLKYARNNGRTPPSNRERLPITALCPADAFGQQLRIRIPVLRVRHPATTTPLESRGHRPGATCRRRRRHWVPLALPRSSCKSPSEYVATSASNRAISSDLREASRRSSFCRQSRRHRQLRVSLDGDYCRGCWRPRASVIDSISAPPRPTDDS